MGNLNGESYILKAVVGGSSVECGIMIDRGKDC